MAHSVDLNRMQIFKQVVALGSFSKAALVLHQPKSRISRNIASLERELGVQLIYRTTRQFRLTEAGRDLYARALTPLNELAHLLENINRFSAELSGNLHVTAPEDVGLALLSEVCRGFMELHPRVHVVLHLTSDVMDVVKNGIDVAIRIGHLKDSSLRLVKIGTVQMGLYLSPALRAAHGELRELGDLHRLPFLAFTHVENPLSFKSVFASNNLLVLKAMAVRGMGFALLPQFLVREERRQGTLTQVFPEWTIGAAPIQIVMPQQKELLPRVRRFVEFTAAQLAPHFAHGGNQPSPGNAIR